MVLEKTTKSIVGISPEFIQNLIIPMKYCVVETIKSKNNEITIEY